MLGTLVATVRRPIRGVTDRLTVPTPEVRGSAEGGHHGTVSASA